MCEYTDLVNGTCRISNEICPFLYYCNKTNTYRALNSMPKDCNVKERFEIPKGYYKVCFQRHGNLYVNIGKEIKIVPNPYDHIPLYVKMIQLKSGKWKIKQAMG